MSTITTLVGDCRDVLKTLPDNSVNCVVTSPPYWNLRDYDTPGQIGLENTPAEFIVELVKIFREIKRVLRPDGTCWVNLGDTYANDKKWGGSSGGKNLRENIHKVGLPGAFPKTRERKVSGITSKSLVGVPWRLAIAMIDDGWTLRRDIIWHKPNPMPESVKDRPSCSHEYLFFFSKTEKYFYDYKAIQEPVTGGAHSRGKGNNPKQKNAAPGTRANSRFQTPNMVKTRNKRTVWTIPLQGYRGSHFATFPEKLIEPCILAGCPADSVVLDPFGGSGTTGRVAARHGRDAILIELNPDYAKLITDRTDKIQKVMAL